MLSLGSCDRTPLT